MELIKNFGLDPMLLGAQIVNFLIILFLLKRFLYKPVLSMLKNRQDTIKDGLKKAEESRFLLEKIQEEEKNVLKKAQTQAAKLIADAKTQTQMLLKEGEESAIKQTEMMLQDAKNQIQIEVNETEKRLIANVSKISLEYLKKALVDLFNEKEQKAVMTRALKQLQQKKD